MDQSTIQEMSLREMMDETSVMGMIFNTEKSWQDASSKLYYDFLETMQSHPTNIEVFEVVADFIYKCTESLQSFRKIKAKMHTTHMTEEEALLETERNTWRLVHCLYQNRLIPIDSDSEMETEGYNYISEKKIRDNFIKNEVLIREFGLIVDWLEKNALDQLDKEPSIEHFMDKTIPWENTLHQMNNTQQSITFTSSKPIVSCLDPDAPIREGKPLHDLDQEDDARLEKRMYLEVRCGRLEKAQALAEHCGQLWRAACLLGAIPYHDPNYESKSTNTKLPVEGNPNRSLWKLNAWELSEDIRIGHFYRGIYASLCGNSKQLLPLAQSWQDALWVHMKSLLDIQLEKEIQSSMPQNYIAMPDEYWKNEKYLEDIFNELHSSKNPLIQSQAMQPSHLIQKYLILNQIPQLLQDMELLMESKTCQSQFIRFMAHLVLFLRQIKEKVNHKIGNKILLAYVRVLIDIGDPTLVAYYTATLSPEEQVLNYASFLERITERQQRMKCLMAAEAANLNVEAITKLTVERIREKNLQEPLDLKGELTKSDMEKIDSLDWLTFYPNQREEALWQANALIRYFLGSEKIDAARKALNKIPSNTFPFTASEYSIMDGTLENLTISDNVPQKTRCSVREYWCHRLYVDAQEGFAEWFNHFHNQKPQELGELPKHATFTEKVAYDHKKTQYSCELERWKSQMEHCTKEVKQIFYNVLLFPDGGWLVDPQTYDGTTVMLSQSREEQMNRLRRLCIPKITLLLFTVMSEMNEHAECIKLVNILASNRHSLFKVFSKEKLQEVFKKITNSSIALMNQKKEPWGFSK